MSRRIRFTTASQVVEAFPQAAPDIGEVPQDVSPEDHMRALAALEDPTAAIIFTALALPKREAVWWACLCLKALDLTEPSVAGGLRVAEAWVKTPEEEQRVAAGKFAEDAYFEGAGAWIAFAAFTTSGSMAPAGLQAVPPAPEISGKSAAMAVLLGGVDEDPLARLAKLRTAVDSALDFASGGDGGAPWKKYREALATNAPEHVE